MKVIAVTSWGLDSTSMVLFLESKGYEVVPLNFSYGSKHNARERKSAEMIFGDRLKKIDIDLSFLTKSSLINKDLEIAKEEYSTENVKQTVVPNRNMIMLSYAVAMAEQEGCSYVALGNHSADHTIYADCRPEFIEALDKAISLATDGRVSLLSPFQHEDKAAIVGLVKDLDGAQEILAKSYSCYEGGEVHCGICATCQERKRAFRESNTVDNTEYLQ